MEGITDEFRMTITEGDNFFPLEFVIPMCFRSGCFSRFCSLLQRFFRIDTFSRLHSGECYVVSLNRCRVRLEKLAPPLSAGPVLFTLNLSSSLRRIRSVSSIPESFERSNFVQKQFRLFLREDSFLTDLLSVASSANRPPLRGNSLKMEPFGGSGSGSGNGPYCTWKEQWVG